MTIISISATLPFAEIAHIDFATPAQNVNDYCKVTKVEPLLQVLIPLLLAPLLLIRTSAASTCATSTFVPGNSASNDELKKKVLADSKPSEDDNDAFFKMQRKTRYFFIDPLLH